MLQCRTNVEEVLQDTFIEVLNKIGSYKGTGSFAGWVRRIAANYCLMLLPFELGAQWSKQRG